VYPTKIHFLASSISEHSIEFFAPLSSSGLSFSLIKQSLSSLAAACPASAWREPSESPVSFRLGIFGAGRASSLLCKCV